MPIHVNLAGKILKGIDGNIKVECCCAEPGDCLIDGDAVPAIKMTVSWNGPPASRVYWNTTFFNGVPRRLCPTYYNCVFGASAAQEWWSVSVGGDYLKLWGATQTNISTKQKNVQFGVGASYAWWRKKQSATVITTTTLMLSGFQSWDVAPTNFTLQGRVDDACFGDCTTSDGITFKWTRDNLNPWDPCSIVPP